MIERIGKVGRAGCAPLGDLSGSSAGYLLRVPGYKQTSTDVTATDYSANARHPSSAVPSNLAPATLWSVDHRLHFVNTSKGLWLDSQSLLNGYRNADGHSLLVFMRIKCAAPPTGADTFFFGNAVGSNDSFGLRVRQSGTAFPVGGDGQLVFACYSATIAGTHGSQAPVNICNNAEHSLALLLNQTTGMVHLFVDGVLSNSYAMNDAIKKNSFGIAGYFCIGGGGATSALPNALACDIHDLHMVYTENNCISDTKALQLVKRLHAHPYTVITAAEWGF